VEHMINDPGDIYSLLVFSLVSVVVVRIDHLKDVAKELIT